jgi:hypothetical protein
MRFVIGIALLILLPGVAAGFVSSVIFLLHTPSILVPIAFGIVAGILLDRFVFHRMPVAETFEHELTHAIVALMFFRRVTGFTVRRSGGAMSHQGGFGGQFGTDCIGLAPYVLPTFAVFSLLARPFVPAPWFPWYDVWIGLTFGYHAWSAVQEISESWTKKRFVSVGTGEVTQTDIARRGYLYSAIFIATVGVAIHGVLIAVLLDGGHGAADWAREVWKVTEIVLSHLGAWLKRLGVELWKTVRG